MSGFAPGWASRRRHWRSFSPAWWWTWPVFKLFSETEISLLGFFVLTAWLAARQVLFTGPIDENKMIGAVCIYLLLGLVWAMLYLLVLAVQPTAFNGVAPTAWHADFPDIVYFSFVSLTTLGFGDVTPAEPIARFLVYLEAVVGQFYLAILVASLVGIRLSDMKRRG